MQRTSETKTLWDNTPENRERDFNIVLNSLIFSSEKEAFNILIYFILYYGENALQDCKSSLQFNIKRSNEIIVIEVSLLYYAVFMNYQNILRYLIHLNVNIDRGTLCKTYPEYNDQSPLMLACEMGNIDIVKLLLQANAQITYQSTAGLNPLMKIAQSDLPESNEICHLILDKAKQKNLTKILLSQISTQGWTAYDYALLSNNHRVRNQILFTTYHLFYQCLVSNTETLALETLEFAFKNLGNDFLGLLTTLDDHSNKPSPLFLTINKNFINLFNRLLELGVPINDNTCYKDDFHTFNQISPLGLACYLNHFEIAQALILKGTDLLYCTNDGVSILDLSTSEKMCCLILNEGKKQHIEEKLITGHSDFFITHCDKGHDLVISKLINIPNFHKVIDVHKLLMHARITSWDTPAKGQKFDKICLLLRNKIAKRKIVNWEENEENQLPYPLARAHYELFNSTQTLGFPNNKQIAIQKAIAEIYRLFCSPQECIVYLKHLNDELVRYFSEKYHQPFPCIDKNTYQFKTINGLYYPVPKKNYIGIEKKRSLQELLILIFQNNNLAKHCYKWIGYIPYEYADKMVKEGHFITESRKGSGIFHGKLSHMLQRLLIMYAMVGKISLSYEDENEIKKITIEDILDGFISLANDHTKETLWADVRDSRDLTSIAFHDPHRLNSVIMHDGEKLGLEALSSYLIDSFCRGFLQLKNAYQKHTFFKAITTNELIAQLDDTFLESFVAIPNIINADIEESIRKSKVELHDIKYAAGKYAIIPKKYDVNQSFTSKPFQMKK